MRVYMEDGYTILDGENKTTITTSDINLFNAESIDPNAKLKLIRFNVVGGGKAVDIKLGVDIKIWKYI